MLRLKTWPSGRRSLGLTSGGLLLLVLVCLLFWRVRKCSLSTQGARQARHSASPLTTVIVTNCRSNAPKAGGIQRVMASLGVVPELQENGLIVFDGAEIDETVWIDEKCRGSCDAAKYREYIETVTSLAQAYFKTLRTVVLPRRACLADALRGAWRDLQTEHVFLLQDDLVLERQFPIRNMLAGMQAHPRLGIVFLLIQNIRYHADWTDDVCGVTGRLREHMTIGGVDYVESLQFNDQAQLTTRRFYDEHIWNRVTSGSFMEYDIVCATQFPELCGRLWYHGKDLTSRGHFAHIDGRLAP